MWWIAAAFAQEQPQEHLFAWRRDEKDGRIESIWVEPDGDVHRVDGFVTVVDGEVLKWASLPYTRFAQDCNCDERIRGGYCLELEEGSRQVLLRFDPWGSWAEQNVGFDWLYPIGQLGPWLFLQEWREAGDCYRSRSEIGWPLYDLKQGSTNDGAATVAFVADPALTAARDTAAVAFMGDWDFQCSEEPWCNVDGPPWRPLDRGEPVARRLIPHWDEQGALVTDLVFEAGATHASIPPNHLTGTGYVQVVATQVPADLGAWAAPVAPVAAFLSGRAQGGWSRSAVDKGNQKVLRAIFDVAP